MCAAQILNITQFMGFQNLESILNLSMQIYRYLKKKQGWKATIFGDVVVGDVVMRCGR